GKSQGLLPLYTKLNEIAINTLNAKVLVVPPPPIQGLGMSGGFQMQIELQDGTFDYRKLQQVTDQMVMQANYQPELQRVMTSFRSAVPQVSAPINRTKAESLGVPIGDAFDTLQTYLGSTYVNLFTKFGQVFPVYVQADAASRMTAEAMRNYYVKNQVGDMVPLGTLTDVQPSVGPGIISLYNLYPSANVTGTATQGYSSGQAIAVVEKLAKPILPAGISFEWTSTAYQEKIAGKASYFIFLLSLVLVYLVLAGQYESWVTPMSVMLSVPLALIGTVLLLSAVGAANNMYT